MLADKEELLAYSMYCANGAMVKRRVWTIEERLSSLRKGIETHYAEIDELLRQADVAMYEAKHNKSHLCMVSAN